MPLLPYALTTLAKVKLFLGITDTNSDDLLESLINLTTDQIEGLCGNRRFLQTVYTDDDYDVPNGSIVFLRQWPVASLQAVEFRTGTIASPIFQAFNANDFLLYGPEGYVKFFFFNFQTFQGLTIRNKLLRFDFTAGYKIDFANELDATKHELPFDITLLTTELVAKKTKLRTAQGIKREATEGQSVEYNDNAMKDLTDEQKSILARYRRIKLTT